MRFPEEFEKAAKQHNITKAYLRPCGICRYEVGYHFKDGKVYFDAGCDCTGSPNNFEERSWEDIARQYNMQEDDKVIAMYDEFWHFKSQSTISNDKN